MVDDERALVALTREECFELLRSAAVGRVVFSERALPAVVPVAFAVLGDAVVIRTDTAGRLATAARGGVLAFEIDDIDVRTHTGWSVVLTGVPEVITDPARRQAALDVLDPWLPRRTDVVIAIPSTLVTGRRIVAREPFPERAEATG